MTGLQRGFARIGCAVDFSERARYAVERASELARRFGAELTLVHVVEPRLARGAVALANGGGTAAPPEPAGEASLAAALDRWRADAEQLCGPSVDVRLRAGDPTVELLQVAREKALDLLVVASDEDATIATGPVTARVVREAPCAVLVTRRRPRADVEIDLDEEELHQYQAV